MAQPISETNNDLNTDPGNELQQLADDELETVTGGMSVGPGGTGGGGVCVPD